MFQPFFPYITAFCLIYNLFRLNQKVAGIKLNTDNIKLEIIIFNQIKYTK